MNPEEFAHIAIARVFFPTVIFVIATFTEIAVDTVRMRINHGWSPKPNNHYFISVYGHRLIILAMGFVLTMAALAYGRELAFFSVSSSLVTFEVLVALLILLGLLLGVCAFLIACEKTLSDRTLKTVNVCGVFSYCSTLVMLCGLR